jgi:hypothetical protein
MLTTVHRPSGRPALHAVRLLTIAAVDVVFRAIKLCHFVTDSAAVAGRQSTQHRYPPAHEFPYRWLTAVSLVCGMSVPAVWADDNPRPQRVVDFNRDIRPILSNKCFFCHGPDAAHRKGGSDGLRLDTYDGATTDLGGYRAVAPGDPAASALIERVLSTDPDTVMPPKSIGKPITPAEADLLKQWIQQGAHYANHWAYVPPVKPALPPVKQAAWPRTGIDHFLLHRLNAEGLSPMPEADRATLIRRVALDLTGLPPTLEELDRFTADPSEAGYRQMVDYYLQQPGYAEHWSRMWLDLARYADSAGYADDPARTIWAYRDYVIRAFDRNLPFDQFTIEQIAGDLLPDATEDQLIATAFHRNTLTNNEGGTSDEEFRTVAVVDRVNTTLAVWMGTTIACAQCHSHKYDPLTQVEFFQLYDFFNQTDDADRTNETPLHEIWDPQDLERKRQWTEQIAELQRTLITVTPELQADQAAWEPTVPLGVSWQPRSGSLTAQSGSKVSVLEDGSFRLEETAYTEVLTVRLPLDAAQSLTGLQVESLPDPALPMGGSGFGGGNFVLTQVKARALPAPTSSATGRFVRIELPGSQKILSLAEVQVLLGDENLAKSGTASQSSTDYNGPAALAIDGNTDGNFSVGSTTHTAVSDNPYWELDLGAMKTFDRIVVWNRTDGDVGSRLAGFKLQVLDGDRKLVTEFAPADVPSPSTSLMGNGPKALPFAVATADYSQGGFPGENVLKPMSPGWAIGGQTAVPHRLSLALAQPQELAPGSTLELTLEFLSQHAYHSMGRLRVLSTDDPTVSAVIAVPEPVRAALAVASSDRTAEQRAVIERHYLSIAPRLQPQRQQLAERQSDLSNLKPVTTVPVMKSVSADQKRITKLQYRGNFQDLGPEVHAGVPAVFPPLPEGAPRDRLTLARWLVSRDNPLTARVLVNRYWEQIFGTGIVATSEEFGSQGELPFHPELLDWLAVDFMDSGWNLHHLLRTMLLSAAYRQSSKMTPELAQQDPDNRLLARGPRFRMSAEMVRDQALAASGLLSPKRFGPPVRPPQPKLGLSAAFGSGVDWQTSEGEDKYRRGLYTTWRRSNPYPSMATFDAPNREVCTLRRPRTNTPLQALVTLNDPVFIEASQSLARRVMLQSSLPQDRVNVLYRLCLARPATEFETQRLTELAAALQQRLATQPQQAEMLATNPLGPAPPAVDVIELAAWTVVANSVLNLDEMFMRR